MPLTPLLKEETTLPRPKGLRGGGRSSVQGLPGHRPPWPPTVQLSPVVPSDGSPQPNLPTARHGTSLKQGHQDYQPQEQDGRLPQTRPNPFRTSASASQGASGKGSRSPFPPLPGLPKETPPANATRICHLSWSGIIILFGAANRAIDISTRKSPQFNADLSLIPVFF